MNYKAGGVTIKEAAVKVLDEKDRDTIAALQAVGVRRNVATIIVYLKDLDEVAAKDIEKGCGLRQPEVSIAMRTLRKKGWITDREQKGIGKGRPMKLYKLTVPIDDIIEYYEEKKLNESSRAMQSIQRLKEMSAT